MSGFYKLLFDVISDMQVNEESDSYYAKLLSGASEITEEKLEEFEECEQ